MQRLLACLDAQPFCPPSPSDLGIAPGVTRQLVREGRAEHGSLTVADVRGLLDAPRRNALAILAWLDGQGVTRRRGDERCAGPAAG